MRKLLLNSLVVLLILIVSGCQILRSNKSELEPSLNEVFSLTEKEEKELSEKALKGDAEAAFRLSNYYSLWLHDSNKTIFWLRIAANNGHKIAQYNLAFRLEESSEESNYHEMIYWYKKAADLGDDDAQTALGRIYETGRVVPKDLYQAKAWYEKAAFSGSDSAILKMVDIYFDGIGCEKDPVTSYSWLLVAETKIHPKSSIGQSIAERKKKMQVHFSPSQIENAEQKFRVLAEKVKKNENETGK